MAYGRSIMTVFAGWVAWIYLLSLLVLLGMPDPVKEDPAAPLRPRVSFVSHDEAFACPPGAPRNVLAGIAVEVSQPLDHDLEIPIKALPGSARPVEHYDVDPDAAAFIEAGQTRGVIRERGGLRDVTVRTERVADKPLLFTLELQNTHDVVTAPDPLGRRDVELLPGSGPAPDPLARTLTRAGFTEPVAEVPEREFTGHLFTIRADRPVDVDADINLTLLRGSGDAAVPVASFRVPMPRGAAETSFRLADVLSASVLAERGLADDDVPEPDVCYELVADPRPPLIGDGDPCFTTVLVADDDAPALHSWALEAGDGRRIRRLLPGQQFWVRHDLSRPLNHDSRWVLAVDGEPLPPVVIPAGETTARGGPFTVAGNKSRVLIETQEGRVVPEAIPPCSTCGGADPDCPGCRKPKCRSCQDRPGGCSTCDGGRGACPKCHGRPGGCMACGFGTGRCGACEGAGGACPVCDGACGTGRCGACDGKGGDCKTCKGTGRCGKCDGKGGPCSACGGGGGDGGSGGGGGGGGGGGKGPVQPGGPKKVGVGPPEKGDFLLVLVNNQRLHEPGDSIAAKVVEAIEGEKALSDAAIVLNESDESELRPGGPQPDPDATFRPFSKDDEDLSGQVQRIVDTIAEKRDAAATENLPVVVVWPERELSSAGSLEPLAGLAARGGGPISILCPDADPEKCRRLAAALQPPEGAKDRVTVRSPKTPELVTHVRDVIHADDPPADPGPREDRP